METRPKITRASRYRDFLKRAEKAQAKAEAIADSRLKSLWSECAASWRYLAKHAATPRV